MKYLSSREVSQKHHDPILRQMALDNNLDQKPILIININQLNTSDTFGFMSHLKNGLKPYKKTWGF